MCLTVTKTLPAADAPVASSPISVGRREVSKPVRAAPRCPPHLSLIGAILSFERTWPLPPWFLRPALRFRVSPWCLDIHQYGINQTLRKPSPQASMARNRWLAERRPSTSGRASAKGSPCLKRCLTPSSLREWICSAIDWPPSQDGAFCRLISVCLRSGNPLETLLLKDSTLDS